MKNSIKHTAFTLAEVLITLGIIGVVTAITMPAVIQNYQKTKTANQLKTVYSLMNQAVKMSEIDNGLITEWEFPENNADAIIAFLNKYITPYVKYTKIETGENERVYLYLNNGIIVDFHSPDTAGIHSSVFFSSIKNSHNSRNTFLFRLGFENSTSGNCRRKKYVDGCTTSGYRPYDYLGVTIDDSKSLRDFIIEGTNKYGCNENAKTTCARLIMHDGWQIKDDYPW